MFDQLRDLNNLRKQAAEMDKLLSAERISGEAKSGLVRLVVNGKHDLLEVQIDPNQELDRAALAQAFKDAYSDAQNKLQKVLMEKFKGLM